MFTKKNIYLILVTAFVLLSLSGCGGGDNIVGKWQSDTSENETLEFFRDGTMTLTSYGVAVTRNYSFPDNDHVKVEMNGLLGVLGSSVYEYLVKGNTLTLSGGGLEMTYSKVR